MKKVWIRALITAAVITLTGMVINLVSYAVSGKFLLATRMNGGECTEWRGFGLLLRKIIPLDPVHAPGAGRTVIGLDLTSLLITFAAGFVLGWVIFFLVRLARRSVVEA